MAVPRRSLVILVAVGFTLVATVIDGVVNGWTALGGITVGGFVLVIALQLAEMRRAKHHD